MKQAQTSIKNLPRLLEAAAKKHNESADATCSVAGCFAPSQGDISDEVFDTVFETVTELAGTSLDNKPDYRRAARDPIANLLGEQRRKNPKMLQFLSTKSRSRRCPRNDSSA